MVFAGSTFLPRQHLLINTRNHRLSIRDRHVGIDCQLGLRRLISLRILNRTNSTHIEDLKHPHKVLLPTRDLVLIVLRKDESKGRPPFTPLADPPLDIGQGPTIETSVSKLPSVHINALAHAVKVPIAPRTDWLSSSDRLPFNL